MNLVLICKCLISRAKKRNHRDDYKVGMLMALLDKFPAFDPTWDANAQVAWFKMYGRLLDYWRQNNYGLT